MKGCICISAHCFISCGNYGHLICTVNQLLGFYLYIFIFRPNTKTLCLNMFYIIINDTKRKHHNTAFLCFVFFVIISKYRILLVIVIIYLHLFHHGTIIPTGTTCKKISSYIRNSACRWFIVKNVKIFRSYVKHF